MARWTEAELRAARPQLADQLDAQKRPKPKRSARVPRPPSEIEETLWQDLGLAGMREGWVREHRFHPSRKWRFDFAHPGAMLAIECDGLTYGGGRHQRRDGFADDCDKRNEAQLLGWRVLHFTRRHVIEDRSAIRTVRAALDHG